MKTNDARVVAMETLRTNPAFIAKGWAIRVYTAFRGAGALDGRRILDTFARDLERVLSPGIAVERHGGRLNATVAA